MKTLKQPLKIRVGISRVSSNQEPYSFMTLELQDESSGIHIAQIDMSIADFGELLSGRGIIGTCDYITDKEGFDLLGKKKEIKHYTIKGQSFFGNNKKSAKQKIEQIIKADASNDGWDLWSDGLSTRQDGHDHNVVLVRYI